MKRRGFLGLLGVIPLVPTLLKEALAKPPAPVPPSTVAGTMELSWWEKDLRDGADREWTKITIQRGAGVEKLYVNGKLHAVSLEGQTKLPSGQSVRDVVLTIPQGSDKAMQWLSVGSG